MTDLGIIEEPMWLSYTCTCQVCGAFLVQGSEAVYNRADQTVRCLSCEPPVLAVAAPARTWELAWRYGQASVPDQQYGRAPVRRYGQAPVPAQQYGQTPAQPVPAHPCADLPTSPTASATEQVLAEPRAVLPLPETAAEAVVQSPPRVEGVAGGSARREYQRRRQRDEQRLRRRWGRLGGLAVLLADERRSTRSWSIGAVGEEALGAELGRRFSEQGYILHDRRIPRTRANIDHMVVLPQGVWVIDAKRYRGRPRLRVSGGIFRPVTRTLTVAGRDQTTLVAGMHKQLSLVRKAVGEEVPVTGALCFVDADWPLLGGPLRVDDQVWAVRPKKMYQMMTTGQPVIDVDSVRERLVGFFPSND